MRKVSSLFFIHSFVLTAGFLAGLAMTFSLPAQAKAPEDFLTLLKKVKATVPSSLKGYQSSTLIGSRKEASANFSRNSRLAVDLEAKTLGLRVIDPPQKDGALRQSGSLSILVYLEGEEIWLKQSFDADPVANWKMPLLLRSDTLSATADKFQYFDMSPSGMLKRENDLTYNLKKRTAEAGFQETKATQYSFVFGIDDENKGLYFERQVSAVSSGEKDEKGDDQLLDLKVRISVTANPISAVEN